MRQRHLISIHFKDNKISKNDFIHNYNIVHNKFTH